MTLHTYLSGIQATGVPHIGNYVGAISQWLKTQDSADRTFYMIADLHAITTPPDPDILRDNRVGAMAGLLAAGLDPKRVVLFFQSSVPEHTELSWLLSSLCYVGELRRMTQFKSKSSGKQEGGSMALFGYPVLQAADILIYQADRVPVGDDQLQHIELARNIAGRFNAKYGRTFAIPEATVPPFGARIMDLSDPIRKMSKSGSESPMGVIFLNDSNDSIRQKVARAVTDGLNRFAYSNEQPGLKNLITLHSALSRVSPEQVVEQFSSGGYGAFKSALTEVLVETVTPIRERMNQLLSDGAQLEAALESSSEAARSVARNTLVAVRTTMGF